MKCSLLILGTSAGSGRGGISTVIKSFEIFFKSNTHDVSFFATHVPDENLFSRFFRFFRTLANIVHFAFTSKSKIKIVYMHVGPKGSLIRKLIYAIFSRMLLLRVVTQYHSPIFQYYIEKKGFFYILLKIISISSNVNLVLSSWWKDYFKVKGFKNVAVLPNPINLPVLELIEKDSEIINILSIGRLVPEKNFELLIEGFSLLPNNYRLIIGGDGPNKQNLTKLAESLGCDSRVSFLGWINESTKRDFYMKSHLFCLPTNYDSFGMVFVEAVSYGLPVVVSDLPPVVDVLKGIPNIYVLSSNDADELADIIKSVNIVDVDVNIMRKRLASMYDTQIVFKRLIRILNCVK